MFSVEDVNYFFAFGTLLLQVVTIVFLAAFFLRKQIAFLEDVARFVGENGLLLGVLVSFAASVAALFYSVVLWFDPCPLCYWQRIFLFPQVLLLGMAWWKKDTYIAEYSIALSIFGAGIALYHHALQMFPNTIPCPATGVSCAQRIVFEFGYITFPLMAFTVFALLIVTMLFVRAQRTS